MRLLIGGLGLMLLGMPSLVLSQTDNRCYTPNGELGNCVPFQECQFVLDVQNRYGRNVPRSIQNQIRQMACNVAKQSTIHLCCLNTSGITAQSASNGNRDSVTKPKAPLSTRQTNANLRRIDPRGLELLNSIKDCGKKANTKLSGGEVTKIGEFPWIVLLKYETFGRPFLCGGSLISDRFVLTAAHCVRESALPIAVRMGEHNLDTEEDCQFLGGRRKECLPPYEEYGIEDIRVHPNYVDNNINNDIALIKLDRPVQFKSHIKPICLPIDSQSQDIAYDQSFFISGWGRTQDNRPSSVLLKAVIRREDLSVCRNYYPGAPVNENHICAVGDGILHTCRGDSGGPLFFRNSFKNTVRYVQYGIVSYGGSRCGKRENQPGVFASVLNMLPWITQNVY
ncbi:hypothetical protein AWZ03_003584 [Drosophila navojoa]|uniref:CLIP domain-containing serine protease n=1 Tax=Drosophila navojoa TaxID=7232 RepID=A0A484BN18_DRONA|nr:phenoloxidase-activating factor 3 [Drosophila navojoa]TDG50074.1 hypothetical protein AWZ03_003584 [Drosophila navojoa]